MSLCKNSMLIRYQPSGPHEPHSFVELKADPGKRDGVLLRACLFDTRTGYGMFTTAPVTGNVAQGVQLGARYSSPDWTAGVIVRPAVGALSTLWLAGRCAGVTAGCELTPRGSLPSAVVASSVGEWVAAHSRVAVAYTPQSSSSGGVAGRNSFTAGVELLHARRLVASFHQHFAINRRVVNPLERSHVVGISNYIDVGMQLVSAVGEGGSGGISSSSDADLPPPGVDIAAAWQINKNWLVKARVGSASCAAAAGFRAWTHPSFMVLTSVQYSYGSGPGCVSTPSVFNVFDRVGGMPGLRWGLVLQVENFGDLHYERGSQALRGQALLQRHEATPIDISNFKGNTGEVMRSSAGEGEFSERGDGRAGDSAAQFM
ncbi:hypothetical protein FOA52_005727 [Chlamydomonas sp. UWO 241]|nr:hypothetical protein FOA52_005727 [Chlamydomonas sp. UWO 241]